MSVSAEYHPIETGCRSTVTISGGLALKTTLAELDPISAAHMATSLQTYADQLAGEPIAVAPLRDVRLVLTERGNFRVWHSMDAVSGQSILRLPEDERRVAITEIVRSICAMSVLRGTDTLGVPIDASAKNWHMDGATPTLIDISPPLARDAAGVMPLVELPSNQAYWEMRYGTVHGVIAGLLYSSLNVGNQSVSPLARIRHLLGKSEEWCYDTLPPDMSPLARRQVEHQIRLRFAPLTARTIIRVARTKLSGV